MAQWTPAIPCPTARYAHLGAHVVWVLSLGSERTFFVNLYGDIISADHKSYSGQTGPTADAAFKKDAKRGLITGATAIGAKGNDDQQWMPAR